MATAAPLSTIIALARAGALDHAWAQFAAAGFDHADDDPAALTVKGRLLKDHALRAAGEAQRLFYLQSAEAYRRAAALQPATYPLINAATLSLLSGDRGQAETIARAVLERIAREPEEPETPYWRAATEAEALLLLGRVEEAQAALAAAIAAAPAAWEDHASTLRQFVAIHALLGTDAAWLDRLRPPRALFYGGRRDHDEAADAGPLAAEAAALIADERIGFGYGGLAAGAELVVAEALLAAGAQLHVVLPSSAERFAAAFVDPQGEGWRARFDAALAAAETVENVRPLGAEPGPRMAALADATALGAAMLGAERLMSEALCLALGPEAPATPLRTRVVAPPPGAARAAGTAGAADGKATLLALLALAVGSGSDEAFEGRLDEIGEALAGTGETALAPHLSGDCILLGFANPAAAAAAARAIHATLRRRVPLRIAGHYGLIPCVRDPFLATLRPTESGADIVKEIAGAIPPDTMCVSHDFAAALAVAGHVPGEVSWIGELQAFDGGSPIGLYALRPAGS